MLKPVDVAVSRNTLVLREVAEGMSAAEVGALFEHESCPRPRSPARAESADSWAVTFVDDGSFDANENTDMSQRPASAPAIDSF